MNTQIRKNLKNKFGQYFTPEMIADFMIKLADNLSSNSKILEPSCGEGIFLELLQNNNFNNITAYEVDKDLAKKFNFVKYESFISAEIHEKFDLIIGNPPYIRWKNLETELKQELLINQMWNKYFNYLCDYLYIFILKSIDLLKENGQLIFICPEYWMNTTNSISLRNYMVENGYFEEIYHFNETKIFDKVAISSVIFKFVKNKTLKKPINLIKYYDNQKLTVDILYSLKNKDPLKSVSYLTIPHFKINERWLLQSYEVQKKSQELEMSCLKNHQNQDADLFGDNKLECCTIGDVCEIGNGLVSGLDKAFQVNEYMLNKAECNATIKVAKAKSLKPFIIGDIIKYIYIEDVSDEACLENNYPNYYAHFQKYKYDLERRYNYNKNLNYWEWAFLRNFRLFNKKEKRILVPSKERISNKNYFRFALADADIFPTQDVTAIFKKITTKESIEYILAYLNIPSIFDWLKYNGIIKGSIVEFSEKPISSIPFRRIDWTSNYEVELHDFISEQTKKYIANQDELLIKSINDSFKYLLR